MELKDEYKPKKSLLIDELQKVANYYGEQVKQQWRVEEWTPAYTDDDFYVGSKRVDHSDWYDSKEDAEAYMNMVEPRFYRNTLNLAKRTLYRKWIPAHWQETWI